MFGLSTKLVTKGKLAAVNLFTVANLPLVINSVEKPNSVDF